MQQAGAYQWDFVTPGLPDGAFEHAPGFSPTPMELRVMLLAHLRPRPDSLVWDVGGGTGALALEIARLMPQGAVHTLERDPDAIRLLEQNRQRFGIANIESGALGLDTFCLQRLFGRSDPIGIASAKGYIGAFISKGFCDCSPDSFSTPGNESHFSFDSQIHS